MLFKQPQCVHTQHIYYTQKTHSSQRAPLYYIWISREMLDLSTSGPFRKEPWETVMIQLWVATNLSQLRSKAAESSIRTKHTERAKTLLSLLLSPSLSLILTYCYSLFSFSQSPTTLKSKPSQAIKSFFTLYSPSFPLARTHVFSYELSCMSL